MSPYSHIVSSTKASYFVTTGNSISSVSLQVRLVDAGFVWTEPHSKRIKVKLTIQKEVHGKLTQIFDIVIFMVPNFVTTERL